MVTEKGHYDKTGRKIGWVTVMESPNGAPEMPSLGPGFELPLVRNETTALVC